MHTALSCIVVKSSFAALLHSLLVRCFELYQCYMQRISRNIINDLTKAQMSEMSKCNTGLY